MDLQSTRQDVSEDGLTTTEENPRATRLFKLLHRLAENEFQPYEHAQVFEFPFYVTEKVIKDIRELVNSALSEVPIKEPAEFQGDTRFEDMSSQRFDNFETFLARAGNRRDPVRVILIWKRFAITDSGEPISGQVWIQFETEKRLYTQRREPDVINRATIELKVSGSDQKWVDQTFEDLVPHIDSSKHGGVFRPLWLFRSEWFVRVAAIVVSWMGFMLGTNAIGRLLAKPFLLEQSKVLDSLVNTPEVGEKLNNFFKWLLTPTNSPWWEPFVILGAGAVSFAIVFVSLNRLLPKLTPNSAIAIGLTSRRAQVYLNTFKFIMFSVILMIVLDILMELVERLF